MTFPRATRPRVVAGLVFSCVLATGCTKDVLTDPPIPPAPPVLARSMRLAVDTAQVLVGDTTTFVATVSDSRGTTIPNASVTWTSSDPAVLQSLGGGRFVATAPGNAFGIAATQGLSATARVTVIEVQRGDFVIRADTAFTVLSTPEEIAAGTLRLRPNSTTTRPVAVGDVVFGSADGGFLEKVMTVRTAGQDIVLSTTPAALTDAIKEGSISVAGDVDVSAALALARQRGDSAILALPKGISIDAAGNIVFDDHDLIFKSSGSVGSFSAEVRLNGTLDIVTGKELKPGAKSFTFDLDIVPCFPTFACVEQMKFGTVVGAILRDGKIVTSIGGGLDGRVGIPLKRYPMGRKKLFNIPIRGQCLVGKMFCYGLFFVIEAYAEVQANAQIEMTRTITMTSGVDAGFRWTPESGFRGTFDPITVWTQSSPTYSVAGQAGVRFGLEPKLLFTVFGRGELSAGVDGAIEATIRTSVGEGENFDWQARVQAVVDAFARAEVDVLGIRARYDTRLRLWDTQLAGANGSLVSLAVSPTTLSLEEATSATLTPVARTVIGSIDVGITPDKINWTVTPAGIATVSASGVVTGIAVGTARVKATIKGTTISAETNVTVTSRGLLVEACFSRTDPGPCPATSDTPQFARGQNTTTLWMTVRQADGTAVTGANLTVRNPFTNALVAPLPFGNRWVVEFAVPPGQTPGIANVVVGPASKAGFKSSSPVNVPLEAVIGFLTIGSCLSKDAGPTFNGQVHCPATVPVGSAGQTYYLWFGADFPAGQQARCGATVTITNPFTGAVTNNVVPLGQPLCLARVAIPVPAGTRPGTYELTVGPARLQDFGTSQGNNRFQVRIQ